MYRVRIDLSDARPPIWRRLDVSSHLPLDEVHEIIQTAFEGPIQFARAILQLE